MMLRSDKLGVTSIIRDLALAPDLYESLIHYFRSSAYSLESLREQWCRCVLRRTPLARCRNRFILVGDGVKQSKEARKMPGVKKMSQESETCSKPQYIHGHLFGALGIIASIPAKRFCIPLKVNIQDGLRKAAAWKESDNVVRISAANHIEQMIKSAFDSATVMGRCYILLDRYFLSKTANRIVSLYETAESKVQLQGIHETASKEIRGQRPPPEEGKTGLPMGFIQS